MTTVPAEQVEAEMVDLIASPGTTERLCSLLWAMLEGGWEQGELTKLVFDHRDVFPDPTKAWDAARYMEEIMMLVRLNSAAAAVAG